MLKCMLEFNPYMRPSMAEIMKHKFFDDIRNPINEHKSSGKLLLPEDSSSNFDYEKSNFKADPKELAQKVYEAIC